MNDRQLSHLSAITALNEMLRKGTFYISTITEVAETIGASPDTAAMRILRPLHCMKIGDMPQELRDSLPRLIERCLSVPAYQFQITDAGPMAGAVERANILRLTRQA